jgi:hypothetical protein
VYKNVLRMLVRGAMGSAKILMKNKRLLSLGLDTYAFEENGKDNLNKR